MINLLSFYKNSSAFPKTAAVAKIYLLCFMLLGDSSVYSNVVQIQLNL